MTAEWSPQLMTTVCVSSVPGSVNEPDNEVEPFSSIAAGPAVSETPVGATLVTATAVW